VLGIFAMSGVMLACASLARMVWIWLGGERRFEVRSAAIDADPVSTV
jgi:DHA1 family bicyclomycin/chloramphenicol resistance-like MFS transporter